MLAPRSANELPRLRNIGVGVCKQNGAAVAAIQNRAIICFAATAAPIYGDHIPHVPRNEQAHYAPRGASIVSSLPDREHIY